MLGGPQVLSLTGQWRKDIEGRLTEVENRLTQIQLDGLQRSEVLGQRLSSETARLERTMESMVEKTCSSWCDDKLGAMHVDIEKRTTDSLSLCLERLEQDRDSINRLVHNKLDSNLQLAENILKKNEEQLSQMRQELKEIHAREDDMELAAKEVVGTVEQNRIDAANAFRKLSLSQEGLGRSQEEFSENNRRSEASLHAQVRRDLQATETRFRSSQKSLALELEGTVNNMQVFRSIVHDEHNTLKIAQEQLKQALSVTFGEQQSWTHAECGQLRAAVQGDLRSTREALHMALASFEKEIHTIADDFQTFEGAVGLKHHALLESHCQMSTTLSSEVAEQRMMARSESAHLQQQLNASNENMKKQQQKGLQTMSDQVEHLRHNIEWGQAVSTIRQPHEWTQGRLRTIPSVNFSVAKDIRRSEANVDRTPNHTTPQPKEPPPLLGAGNWMAELNLVAT